jgi:hypothetical protein
MCFTAEILVNDQPFINGCGKQVVVRINNNGIEVEFFVRLGR